MPYTTKTRSGSYRSLMPTNEEEHPIDKLVAQQPMVNHLRRRISRSSEALMLALGDRTDLWLKLERLLSEREMAREEAYFDAGFEHGLAAGRTEAFQASLAPRLTHLTRELRTRALLEYGLSAQERVAALLLTAWSLCSCSDQDSTAGRTSP